MAAFRSNWHSNRSPRRASTIRKSISKSSSASLHDQAIVGRRVSIPQYYAGIEDDGDGFCFGGRVLSVEQKLAVIKYDYTADIERHSIHLVRRWLVADLEPDLIEALSRL